MREQELIELRRAVHAHPELSGHEHRTHDTIRDYVKHFAPTRLFEHLGKKDSTGTGLAAVFDSGAPGKTVLVRAELDALPSSSRPRWRTGRSTAASCTRAGTTGT
ncbi:MAG: hypothetical protein R3B49_02230 [Phycisphaerales bacterium]